MTQPFEPTDPPVPPSWGAQPPSTQPPSTQPPAQPTPLYPPPLYPPPAAPPEPTGPGWRGRVLAVAVAALVVAGAGVGVGMAATSHDSGSPTAGKPASDPTGGKQSGKSKHAKGKHAGKSKQGKGNAKAVDPARAAWSHKYGQDRTTMPTLSPASSGSAQQRAAATDLLMRTEAATAKYSDLAAAKAAGYDLQASLARKEKKSPKTADRMKQIDAGNAPSGQKMPMLHVGNKSLKSDGKVLDPNAPETLMYSYEGDGKWKLIGVMYVANESYPHAPPNPGAPISRWHYHDKSGARGLMMHIFFVPGNDLAHAYATEMS